MATPSFSGIVYLHYNPISQKGYVGQTTKGIDNRWELHCRCARSPRTPAYKGLIAKAIRKYGADSFEHQVLSTASTQAELDNLEKIWITLLQTKVPNGYNLADGGYAAAGHVVTPEVKAVLSAAAKAQWQNPEFLQKVENGLYSNNGNLSPEHEEKRLANLRAVMCGKKQSAETIAKRIAKTTGMKRTAEFCARQSEARLGKTASEETKQKMSQAQQARSYESKIKGPKSQIGRKRTPEQVQNILNGITPEGRERNRLSLLGNQRTLGYKFSPEVIAKRTATAKRNRELKKVPCGS